LEEGGLLRGKDPLWIKIGADKDAYAYVLFYNSAGEIEALLPDEKPVMLRGGKAVKLYGDDSEGLQLVDEPIGMQKIFLLASETPIDDFDKKLEELRKSGISEIEKVFPEASVRSFHFRYE